MSKLTKAIKEGMRALRDWGEGDQVTPDDLHEHARKNPDKFSPVTLQEDMFWPSPRVRKATQEQTKEAVKMSPVKVGPGTGDFHIHIVEAMAKAYPTLEVGSQAWTQMAARMSTSKRARGNVLEEQARKPMG